MLEGSGVGRASIALISLSTTLATNALVEGQGGGVCLVLIGFDGGSATRARIAEALRGDPCVRLGGGHDAAGHASEALDIPALDWAIADLEGSVAAFAVAGMFVSGCAKARINGEQQIPHPAICGAGDDSERWVGI